MVALRWCPVCGQVLTGPVAACPNLWCRRPGRAWSVTFAVGWYQGRLRRAISDYKYRRERHLAAVFARMLASFLERHPVWFEEFDVITGVPSFTGPGGRRDWDPVGGLLEALAARVGPAWPVEPDLVVKTAETPGMTGLGWAARQGVARGPLRRSLAPGRDGGLEGSRVLVLDDVFTEGGTMQQVAEVLRRMGASDVAGLVLARPVWQPAPPGGDAGRGSTVQA